METKRFFVYQHKIGNRIFYVGCGEIRDKRGGGFKTMHERAFTTSRPEYWKRFVAGRKYEAEIIGHYDTKEEMFRAEMYYIKLNSKTVLNKHISKSVYQFNIDGEFVQEWETLSHAARALNIDRGSIIKVVNGDPIRKTAGGYLWSYSLNPTIPYQNKPVLLKKDLSGNIIKTYESISQAIRELGVISSNAIRNCLCGVQKQAYGFKWERIERQPEWAKEMGYSESRLSKRA